jgi:tRNA/tmRNA/rRNA uracil-C5-methylase (TrmA/RlmC/RlmD family)
VLDAYCGVGTLGILLAREAAGVVGVEAVEPAVEDARFNAERNGVENAEFICGKVEKYDWEPGRFEIALVDPPRAGCHTKFINRLVEKGPAKIVYISCNPLTMAADLARLQERYRAEWVQPMDMFPHTVHVESVALLKAKH